MAKGIMLIGDPHLSQRIYSKRPEIEGDAFCLLDQAISIAIKEDYVPIFLGDQFDVNYPPVRSVDFWYQQISRLSAAGIKGYIIDGNHDPGLNTDSEERSWSCIHPNIIHIQPECGCNVKVGNKFITFNGFDYQPTIARSTELLTKCLAQNPDFIVMHQYPRQAISIEGAWDIDLEAIQLGVPVFCGHIHNNFEAPLSGGGKLYVVGSTHPRAIDQGSQKVYYVINEKMEVTKHNFHHRKILSYSVFNAADVPKYIATLKKDISAIKYPDDPLYHPIRKPIVSLKYDPTITGVIEKSETVCKDVAHLVETPKFQQVNLITNVTDEISAVNLQEIVVKSVTDKHAGHALVKLLDSPEEATDILDDYVKRISNAANT